VFHDGDRGDATQKQLIVINAPLLTRQPVSESTTSLVDRDSRKWKYSIVVGAGPIRGGKVQPKYAMGQCDIGGGMRFACSFADAHCLGVTHGLKANYLRKTERC
jgi:hypothetical protein